MRRQLRRQPICRWLDPPPFPPRCPTGIGGFWRDESLTWASCPDYALLPPPSATAPSSRPLPKKPPVVDTLMSLVGVPPVVYANILPQWVLDYTPGSTGAGGLGGRTGRAQETFPDEAERDPAVPGCAWTWAKEAHPCVALSPLQPGPPHADSRHRPVWNARAGLSLNCAYVWPADEAPGEELATAAYWGKVKGDLVVEKQLAMAGSASLLRLCHSACLQTRADTVLPPSSTQFGWRRSSTRSLTPTTAASCTPTTEARSPPSLLTKTQHPSLHPVALRRPPATGLPTHFIGSHTLLYLARHHGETRCSDG